MPDTSQKTSASDTHNPAVLKYRGLDLEAMTALQTRNINAIRRMTNLMLDGTEAITERQAAFLKASADQLSSALERREVTADPKAVFERQTEAYRDLVDSFAVHVSQLTEITSKCCSSLIREAGDTQGRAPDGAHLADQPKRSSGTSVKN